MDGGVNARPLTQSHVQDSPSRCCPPGCANEVQLCPWLVAALFVIAKKTENKYPPMAGNGSMTSQYFHIEECEAGCTENDREDYPDTVFN